MTIQRIPNWKISLQSAIHRRQFIFLTDLQHDGTRWRVENTEANEFQAT